MSKLELEDLLDSDVSGGEGDDAEQINQLSHGRLVDRVKALYGSREIRQRGEASQNVSEFDFSREHSGGVTAFDMLKDLNNTAALKKKRNKILKIKKKAAALPVPLPKVSRERLQRAIGYAKTTSELGKWDSIVEHNEAADQIRFPLNDEPIRLEQSGDFVKQFKPSTELESKIESLLSSSKHRLDSDAGLTQFEEEKLKVLSKEEATARLSELRRLRALMHAEALRNRRVRKIKSRKFHRVQRKDKMKAAIREFEQLKVTDPQKALEKLEELERIRREERMSLRHKRKSKWAAKLAKTGKFDKDAQLALRERIELARELETKVKMDSDADENEDDEVVEAEECPDVAGDAGQQSKRDSSDEEERAKLERSLHEDDEKDDPSGGGNPWLRKTFFEEIKSLPATTSASKTAATGESNNGKDVRQSKSSENDDKSDDEAKTEARRGGRRVLSIPEHMKASPEEIADSVNKSTKKKPSAIKKSSQQDLSNVENDTSEDSENELISESTAHVDPYADNSADQQTQEDTRISDSLKNSDEAETGQSLKRKREEEMPTTSAVCIDPEKVLEIGANSEKKLKSRLRLSTAVEDENSSEEESDDDDSLNNRRASEERQKKLIQEAFAGDDVVEDFIKEQREKDATERAAEREAALKQKGLEGDWVTPNNIHRLDDRKKKFLESRRKKFEPRAAIVHDDANNKGIRAHRVADVPKGFTKVSQFEAVLKQPVGSMFNTPTAFQELTKPRIVTARGKIIKPIDQNALVKSLKAPDLKQSRPQRKTIK